MRYFINEKEGLFNSYPDSKKLTEQDTAGLREVKEDEFFKLEAEYEAQALALAKERAEQAKKYLEEVKASAGGRLKELGFSEDEIRVILK